MNTYDDKMFCVLHTSLNGIQAGKLSCCFYLYQLMGFDLSMRYKVTASGLSCRELDRYLNTLISMDMVSISDGVVTITDSGENYYYQVPMFSDEWDKLDEVKMLFNELSLDELFFIVLTDIYIVDTIKSKGVDALISNKDFIKNSLSNLSCVYSDENFDYAIRVIRFLKGEKEEI